MLAHNNIKVMKNFKFYITCSYYYFFLSENRCNNPSDLFSRAQERIRDDIIFVLELPCGRKGLLLDQNTIVESTKRRYMEDNQMQGFPRKLAMEKLQGSRRYQRRNYGCSSYVFSTSQP